MYLRRYVSCIYVKNKGPILEAWLSVKLFSWFIHIVLDFPDCNLILSMLYTAASNLLQIIFIIN